jgi:hypothetical protein
MGSVLARQLSKRNEVRIGSRSLDRAIAAAAKIRGTKGGVDRDVAAWCDTAVLSVPFYAIGILIGFTRPLSGKLVISAVNPIVREGDLFQYALADRSAAELVASALPLSRVATAFNNVPAAFLRKSTGQRLDILVAADSKRTYEEAAVLVRSIPGLRPLYVGPLSQAQSVERLTVMVLNAAKLGGRSDILVRFVSSGRKQA